MAFWFVVWIVIRSCAAMAVGMGGCHYALSQATAPSPADLSPRGTEATEPATSPGKDEEKSRLEREKLKAEIDKLKFDKNTTLVTSITCFLSALGAIIAFLLQRHWAQKSQKQSEVANLQPKIAEFVMSSVGPTMARQRLKIITDLYKNKENLIATLNMTDVIRQDAFPGTRRDQLRIELFKAMAAKAGNEEAARKAFKYVFPDERFSNISGLGPNSAAANDRKLGAGVLLAALGILVAHFTRRRQAVLNPVEKKVAAH